jgi:hypothetical protein
MARHSLDADKAFEMLRNHSQHSGRKLSDVAMALVDSHLLLVPQTAHALNGNQRELAAVVVSDLPTEEIDLPR